MALSTIVGKRLFSWGDNLIFVLSRIKDALLMGGWMEILSRCIQAFMSLSISVRPGVGVYIWWEKESLSRFRGNWRGGPKRDGALLLAGGSCS